MTVTSQPELRDYQVADLSWMIGTRRGLLLHDPGVGKTPPVCVYAYYLATDLGKACFWVMPKSLLKKNKDELHRFTPFQDHEVVILDGTPKQRAELIARQGVRVWLMGFRRFADDWEKLLAAHPEIDCLLVDELHMGFGGDKSQQTQAMKLAMKRLTHFFGMTGTLINGRLDTAYPSIEVIEPRYYGSHQQFLNFHGEFGWDGKLCGWRNHWKLTEILGRHAIRRTFTDVFGPEAKVIVKELCPMHQVQREAYDEFASKALLELEDDWLDGTLPGVAVIRARQIMAHPHTFKILKPGELTGKDERLAVHLADHERSGKPLVIYASLIPEQQRIFELVSKTMKAGLINSTVSAAQRSVVDQDFRAGKLQVIVGSPATAAVGFNWEHVDHMVFASLDYMDSNFVQAVRRAIRGVRKTPLLVTVLEYEKSIDQRIFEIVDFKSLNAALVDSSKEKLSLSDDRNPDHVSVDVAAM